MGTHIVLGARVSAQVVHLCASTNALGLGSKIRWVMWTPPWTWKRPSKPAPPPPEPPALPQLVEEFKNRPFYGASYGEAFPPPAEPQTTTTSGYAIPPPPWADMEGDLDLAQLAAPPQVGGQVGDALAQMKIDADDVDWPEFGPPAPAPTPLLPAAIPEWPEEERRREQQARERDQAAPRATGLARGEPALAEELPDRYPPPKRGL